MSTIRTQEQALAALTAHADDVERLAARYETSGYAIKATTARELARVFAERASVYRQLPKLYKGRNASRWIAVHAAADAAEANDRRSADWSVRADADQAHADRIARESAAAFAELPASTRNLVGEKAQKYRQRARRLHAVPDPVDLDDFGGVS